MNSHTHPPGASVGKGSSFTSFRISPSLSAECNFLPSLVKLRKEGKISDMQLITLLVLCEIATLYTQHGCFNTRLLDGDSPTRKLS